MQDFLVTNWLSIAIAFLAFLKVVANLTRTDVDNKIFSIIDIAIDYLIPPKKSKK